MEHGSRVTLRAQIGNVLGRRRQSRTAMMPCAAAAIATAVER